jgi:hypothetical protein
MSGSGYITESKALIAGRMRELTDALRIDRQAYCHHILCVRPQHGDRKPSFRLDARKERAFCTCGSFDVLDLARDMLGLPDLISAADWARQALGLPGRDGKRETPAERQSRQARIAEARQRAEDEQRRRHAEDAERNAHTIEWIRESLWGWSYPARGTVVETYLRSRSITVLPEIISYVPAYGPDRLPAMLVPFGVASEPEPGRYEIEPEAIVGAHVTLLDRDGRKAVDREGRTKIILGRGHDAPLMLVPPNDGLGLVITEGIEDALSFHQTTGLGAWAAGTANRLPGLARHVPDWIECVTLIEDGNNAGQAGCKVLAIAFYKRGIEVRIERGRAADAAA